MSDEPKVVAPPPLVFAGGLGLGFALDALAPSADLPAGVRLAGIALLVAGGALAGAFARSFRRRRTPISPYATPTALVTDGPYRLSRNPGYLGMALTSAGIALLADAPWALAGVAAAVAVVDRGVIVREEVRLQRAFGAEYARYRERVRRWL